MLASTSWPSAKTCASTTMGSPWTRFTLKRPPSISGMTRSMTARTRPSASARRVFLTCGFAALAFMLEVDHGKRRERYADRMISPVRRYGMRAHAAVVADAAAAVVGRIRVDELAPITLARDTDEIVLPRHRREVADDENDVFGVARFADERHRALLGVAAVDPLETVRVEVELIKGRLGRVDAVQIGHPVHEAAVLGVLEHPPFEAFLVLPFAALA